MALLRALAMSYRLQERAPRAIPKLESQNSLLGTPPHVNRTPAVMCLRSKSRVFACERHDRRVVTFVPAASCALATVGCYVFNTTLLRVLEAYEARRRAKTIRVNLLEH